MTERGKAGNVGVEPGGEEHTKPPPAGTSHIIADDGNVEVLDCEDTGEYDGEQTIMLNLDYAAELHRWRNSPDPGWAAHYKRILEPRRGEPQGKWGRGFVVVDREFIIGGLDQGAYIDRLVLTATLTVATTFVQAQFDEAPSPVMTEQPSDHVGDGTAVTVTVDGTEFVRAMCETVKPAEWRAGAGPEPTPNGDVIDEFLNLDWYRACSEQIAERLLNKMLAAQVALELTHPTTGTGDVTIGHFARIEPATGKRRPQGTARIVMKDIADAENSSHYETHTCPVWYVWDFRDTLRALTNRQIVTTDVWDEWLKLGVEQQETSTGASKKKSA